jgi:predicted RNase H-like HicB family nuclease
MEIPVIVEPVNGNGYRATWVPGGVTADGRTRDEALRAIRQAIQARLAAGTEIRTVNIPGAENSWSRYEGVYENDPLFDEWQQAIAEYRRERN